MWKNNSSKIYENLRIKNHKRSIFALLTLNLIAKYYSNKWLAHWLKQYKLLI